MPDDSQNASPLESMQFVEMPFPTIYTNSVNVGTTFFEFALLVIERLDKETAIMRARIVMTPAHAKLLSAAMARQVSNYEARFGEIKLPPPGDTTASSEPEQPPSQSQPDASPSGS